MSLKKIISGGQTGADIAGIDAAIEDGMPYGGSLPEGRKTENGPLDSRYTKMTEMSVGGYQEMTEQNVKDADGTVIFSHGKYTGVSALTGNYAKEHNKPALHLDLDVVGELTAIELLIDWIYKNNIEILNVAGSRESKDEHIYDEVHSIIKSTLNTIKTAEVVNAPEAPPAAEPSLQEPVIATPPVMDEEVATGKAEENWLDIPDLSSASGLASLIERWPKIGRNNLAYIGLGILVLAIALIIVPKGFKKNSSVKTTVQSSSMSEGRNVKPSGISGDNTSPGAKTPKQQNPQALSTTTSSTEQAAIQTPSADAKIDSASPGGDQLGNKENKPPQSLSNPSGVGEKTAIHLAAPIKKPSQKQNRCKSLYEKIARGKVLKKSEAKFLATQCK